MKASLQFSVMGRTPSEVMIARLQIKIFLATLAMLVAAFFAIATLNSVNGLANMNVSAAALIKESCPFHLVRPEWITGGDQTEILFRWTVLEFKVRLIVVLGLWILSLSFFVWQYLRKLRHAHKCTVTPSVTG